MKKRINRWVVALLSATMLAGCTGSFEEINTDPDALSSVPATNLLGNILRRSAEQIGGDMDGYGTYAGYIVKIQYMDYLAGLIPTNNTFGNRWYNCYYGNTQLGLILESTEEAAEGNKNIRWAARIFQNFLWLYNLDTWGDMPYSEALKGDPEKGGILNARYDKQEDIYPAVMAELKAIADEMAAGHGSDEIGEGDFLFGGDVLQWQKFCNSLRLRAAIRLSNVAAALSKSTIEEIANNPGKYPLIEANEENAYFWWQNSSPYFERWYDNSRTRDDFGLFDTFIGYLQETEDPRLHIIAKPAVADGEYHGFQNGAATQPQLSEVSRIGALYRDNPTGFTPFYKSCETYYILAEAAMLGWNVGITAQEAYEKAVRLSMEDNGVSEADTEAYLAGKGKWNNTKERIWWDQWVALFKENHEAWCLYRRTGIPTRDTNYVSVNSIYGTAHNDQPFRIPYPNNEYLYNKGMLDEALVGIVDYCWGKQLWWDTRTGVY
ncbi:MAG: SusD/RagB family nutrient-binding outer membrane lipoprotein [Tannerellaceae bacterium]|nr:SusD/RagB family nutrient-binding outer membrane lipoprotein [Tannerellaceae bacterium]